MEVQKLHQHPRLLAILFAFIGIAIVASAGLILASFAVGKNNPWILLISCMIFVGSKSFSVPSLISAITEQVPRTHSTVAISLYMFTLFLGASMGTIISHLLLHFNFFLAFLVLAFIAVIPGILTLFIKKELSYRKEMSE